MKKRHTKSLFVLQVLVLGALLLVTLLDLELQLPAVVLTAGLILLWLAGAVVEPFSLLLSALALSATTSTLSHLNIDGVSFSVNGLLTAGLGAACGLAIVIHFRQQFRSVAQIRRWLLESSPLSLLLMWALIRTPGVPSLSDAISDILIWGALLLVYVLARAHWIENPHMLIAGERAFLYVGFLTLGMVAVEALLGNIRVNYTSSQMSLGIHTTVGARAVPFFFTLATIPVLVHLRSGREKRKNVRRLLVALVVVMAIWNFFSLSRTSLLGLGGIVLPLTLLRPRTLWKAAVSVALGTLITSGILLSPLFPRPAFVELNAIVTLEQKENGDSANTASSQVRVDSDALRVLSTGRTAAWQYLVETGLRDHPVVGFGTGASHSYVTNIIPTWNHPHSDYVRVFFDLGAIGLLIFVLSWAVKAFTLWQRWVRSRPNTSVALRSFAALTATGYVLLTAATDNTIVYFFLMGPLSLMLAMADATTIHAEARPEPELAQPADFFSVAERMDQQDAAKSHAQ